MHTKGVYIQTRCHQCGSLIQRTPGHVRKQTRFYCSGSCRLAGLNSQPRPHFMVNCLTCHKPFKTARGKPRKYCSRECMWADPSYCQRRASAKPRFSYPEKCLHQLLNELRIAFIPHFTVGRYTADCYVPVFNLLIEMDGEYWHKDRQAFDAVRDQCFIESGYQVIHVLVTGQMNKKEEKIKKEIRRTLFENGFIQSLD